MALFVGFGAVRAIERLIVRIVAVDELGLVVRGVVVATAHVLVLLPFAGSLPA
jgi:hypothetical protein